ncbi:MAG: hypothetical protein ABI182_01270 [Candidatus Baltobacteraceae bacterium]
MFNSMVVALLLLSTLSGAALTPANASDAHLGTMMFLTGSWRCDGVFPASGKTISSTMTFGLDMGGAALVKHHDDTSSQASYHAIELWAYDTAEKRFSAAVQDNSGGVREFTSPGWVGSTLVWTSASSVKPLQQFAYKKRTMDVFSVDWRVSRDGSNYVVGDTLNCKRS